jgi:hypothetical protein
MAAPSRLLPHSLEAEEYLISCCLLDGADVLSRCMEARIVPESFYDAKHGIIYQALLGIHSQSKPIDVAVLAEELKTSGRFEDVGGYAFLIQVSGRIPTTAQAGYFIEKVRELQLLREVIRQATGIVEGAYSFTGGIDDFLASAKTVLGRIGEGAKDSAPLRGVLSFQVPRPGDPSILLGNRYLNRGDGAFLVSTSGMGKSSMSLQMAVHWSLGIEVFGIPCNGPLRSLIIQAEDSEGDIGEVAASITARLSLTPEQVNSVNERVVLHTMKTRRNFFPQLRSLVAKHKPDLVWINPLQSFMDGDIKDSADLGRFLRDGLGEINSENKFAWMVVHHTTKPPAEKTQRAWNEVMYDMAGGAEIVNWARAILSLRPSETEGRFNLILAKRGRRAGVAKQVPAGAGFRSEVVTSIPLCYSNQTCTANGLTIPMIYWEKDGEAIPEKEVAKKEIKLNFLDAASAIPEDKAKAMNYSQIHRVLSGKKKVSQVTVADALIEWTKEGRIKCDAADPNMPRYYRG